MSGEGAAQYHFAGHAASKQDRQAGRFNYLAGSRARGVARMIAVACNR